MVLNNELEGLWKETVMVKFKFYLGIFPDGLWKTTKYIRKFGIATNI
jgi:hypothetical protein